MSCISLSASISTFLGLTIPTPLLLQLLSIETGPRSILQSSKPKLFIMGTRDGFTSVKQLKNKLNSAAGRNDIHLIEGVSHFEMEGPAYDAQMVNVILEFIASL